MSDKNVNDPSPAYDEMELDRELPRIFMYDGQRGIRDGGEIYLPKYEGEDGSASAVTTEYGGRLSRSVVVNFYKDAIQNIVGRIFQRPLVMDGSAPEPIVEFWRDVDNSGTQGDVFAARVLADAIGQGLSHVLVDYPITGDFENAAAEQKAGIRPRWVFIRADRAIESLGAVAWGRDVLSRCRIRESDTGVEDYAYATSDRVREFLMGDPNEASRDAGSAYYVRWRLWEQGEDDEWVMIVSDQVLNPSLAANPAQKDLFISAPIVPFYGERTGFFMGKPPLLTLSDLNLQHYQKKSDLDNIERIANVPQLVMEGVGSAGDDDMEVGAYRLWKTPEGTTLKYLEIQGAGIAHLKDSIRHLEEHIRQVGKEPTMRRAVGQEVATARLLDEASSLTQAQAWAIQGVDALNRCLEITAAWMGIAPPVTPWLAIAEDVLEALARPEAFQDVKDMYTQGALSTMAYIEEAKRYGVLDRDFDADEDADIRQEDPVISGGDFGREPFVEAEDDEVVEVIE